MILFIRSLSDFATPLVGSIHYNGHGNEVQQRSSNDQRVEHLVVSEGGGEGVRTPRCIHHSLEGKSTFEDVITMPSTSKKNFNLVYACTRARLQLRLTSCCL